MEKIVERGRLYDFYDSLLTEHQQRIYEDAVLNDMSLSELAEEYEISRQGIHDLIKRCDKILIGYDDKLHLIEKFDEIKNNLTQIDENVDLLLTDSDDRETVRSAASKIKVLASDILEEL